MDGVQLPHGVIIGTVRLYAIITNSASRWARPGFHHWILDDPRPLPHIPIRGMPGLQWTEINGQRIPWITCRQPWASLIIAGHKTVENRSWAVEYRGPLAIHAGHKIAEHATTWQWSLLREPPRPDPYAGEVEPSRAERWGITEADLAEAEAANPMWTI